MINIKILFTSLAFILSIWGLLLIKKPIIEGVKNLTISGHEKGVYKGQVDVLIQNENKISISASDLEFKLKYRNQTIAVGHLKETFKLDKKIITTLPIKFELFADSLMPYFDEIIKNDTIELISEIEANVSLLKIKIYFSDNLSLNIKDIIDNLISDNIADKNIQFLNPRIENIKFDESTLLVDLKVRNNYPFDLNISMADISVYGDEGLTSNISSWKRSEKITIPSIKDTVFTAPFLIKNKNLIQDLFSKIGSKELIYYMSGYVKVLFEGHDLKIDLKTQFSVDPFTREVKIQKKNN